MKRRNITLPVYLSPLWVFYVLYETSLNDAYPPEADSIAIPFFDYILLCYPIALYFALKIKSYELARPRIRLWNSRRRLMSFLSLALSIYPLGVFWLVFLFVSVQSHSYGSIFICLAMLLVTGAVRTYAIQDEP